jgi:hypothetical protein
MLKIRRRLHFHPGLDWVGLAIQIPIASVKSADRQASR